MVIIVCVVHLYYLTIEHHTTLWAYAVNSWASFSRTCSLLMPHALCGCNIIAFAEILLLQHHILLSLCHNGLTLQLPCNALAVIH